MMVVITDKLIQPDIVLQGREKKCMNLVEISVLRNNNVIEIMRTLRSIFQLLRGF
jgi:hypothetical protein